MNREGIKDWLVCLSIANLVCIGLWREVFQIQDPTKHYFMHEPPASVVPIFVFFLVLSLAGVLYGLDRLLSRLETPLARGIQQGGTCLLLLSPLTALLADARLTEVLHPRVGTVAAIAVFQASIFSFCYPDRALYRVGRSFLLLLAPLFFVQTGSAFWGILTGPAAAQFVTPPRAAPAALAHEAKSRNRLIWMLFDEMDYEFSFDLRPGDVRLPELDELRKQSFFATHSHAPTDMTGSSVPSILGAQQFADPGDHTVIELHRVDTFFSRARSYGMNTGLAGWYIPYCRELAGMLVQCHWEPNLDLTPAVRGEFFRRKVGLFSPAYAKYLLALMAPSNLQSIVRPVLRTQYGLLAEETRLQYDRMLKATTRMVKDQTLDIVFMHWMVPHPPALGDWSELSADPPSFAHNMRFVDQAIGQIRGAMRSEWEQSIVLVTADHPLRPWFWADGPVWTNVDDKLAAERKDPRIPFILKLPGQSSGYEYQKRFSTLLSRDLLLAVLRGNIATYRDVAAWIDTRRDSVDTCVGLRLSNGEGSDVQRQ